MKIHIILVFWACRREKSEDDEREDLRRTFMEITESMFASYELRPAMRMIGEAKVKSACIEPEARFKDKLLEMMVYFTDIRTAMRERLADERMQELIEVCYDTWAIFPWIDWL